MPCYSIVRPHATQTRWRNAEARLILLTLSAQRAPRTLKSCPCYKARSIEFFTPSCEVVPCYKARPHATRGAGAEARLILLALSARLKSCPVTKPSRMQSQADTKRGAGAEARLILLTLSARLKSCPVTKPGRMQSQAEYKARPKVFVGSHPCCAWTGHLRVARPPGAEAPVHKRRLRPD